jgi:hypothetical protein
LDMVTQCFDDHSENSDELIKCLSDAIDQLIVVQGNSQEQEQSNNLSYTIRASFFTAVHPDYYLIFL